jgi:SAM-dependent methyltransferase
VVATDLNSRFLSLIRAPNLKIRQHNILRDELEEGHYDLVHCRKLLIHLPEPENAVKRMANAVRPGGWLLVEEDDYGSALSLDMTEPSAAAFTEVMKTYIGSVRRRGIADFYLGRRIRGLVEGSGFVDVGQEGWTTVLHGGDRVAHMHAPLSGSYPSTTKSLIAQRVFTMEQAEIMERTLMDSALYIPWYTIFCAWGRKPTEGGS